MLLEQIIKSREGKGSLLFPSIAGKRHTAIYAAERNSGGFGSGVPPLPIPNREVKPGRADGTAPQCGRVGRRLLEERRFQEKSWGVSLVLYNIL